MDINVKGVVLSETNVGEYDKYMTVLTAEYGKMSVYGSNVRRLKNKNFTATQLFSYSEFYLTQRGDHYVVKESMLIDSFYGLRKTIDSLSIAGYLAEVASYMSVEGENAEELLRLVLNSFYLIAQESKPLKMIKGVFELRAACIEGFAPDLVACNSCKKHNLNIYYFDAEAGNFYCEDCFKKSSNSFEESLYKTNESEGIYPGTRLILILSPDVYLAMRYVVYSKQEKLFSFVLQDKALDDFSSVCEKYLLCHTEYQYKTLSFLKQIM
ncbi:MAG: DNA repair protein RecO [Clostridia bacterium]|nr:DNA repair protein RecO [Clostridia bacterium]